TTGLAVGVVKEPAVGCNSLARPAATKSIIHGKDTPEAKWAGGTMSAHLDFVGKAPGPELYLGRLTGTAGVPEHDHPTSSDTLIAMGASGTYTRDGQEHRLGARQLAVIPRGAKHAWKPDPGSKLVALQMYDPPGPEQRFVALAAADAAKAADAGAPKAKKE